jgi:membrane-associated phospholipid phosphatase
MKKIIQNKWIVSMTILAILFLPYFIVNHLPLERKTLPFICGEERIPFLPWTFIVYLSVFIQAILVVRYMPEEFIEKIKPVAIVLVLSHVIVFILLPVKYPRDCYTTDSNLIHWFQAIDTHGNCFPSLHVSGTILSALCFGLTHKSKTSKFFMWMWTVLITLSVLTTKQHYVVDIISAVFVTVAIILFFRKRLKPCY